MKKRLADVVSDDIDVGVYRLQQGDIDRTPFIFKEPLGQTREIKVALSGLFGRLSLAPILNPPEARAASGGGTQAILPRMVSTTRAPAQFGPPRAASHRRVRGVVDEVSSSPSPDYLTLLSQIGLARAGQRDPIHRRSVVAACPRDVSGCAAWPRCLHRKTHTVVNSPARSSRASKWRHDGSSSLCRLASSESVKVRRLARRTDQPVQATSVEAHPLARGFESRHGCCRRFAGARSAAALAK